MGRQLESCSRHSCGRWWRKSPVMQVAKMQSGGQGPGPVRRWDHLDIMMDQLWNLGKGGFVSPILESGEWEHTGEKLQNRGLDRVLKHGTKNASHQWKKKQTTTEAIETRNDLDGYQRHYAKWKKKPASKGYTQSDSMCVTFLKWWKYRVE